MYNQPPNAGYPYPQMHMAPPGFPIGMPPMMPLPMSQHMKLIPQQGANAAPIEKPAVPAPAAPTNTNPSLDKLTTAFIGNISESIKDDWLEALFKNLELGLVCYQQAAHHLSFGFATFESAKSLHTLLYSIARERRIEPGAPLVPNPISLKGKKLLVKVDVGARKTAIDLIAGLVAEGGVSKVEELEKEAQEKVDAYLKETGFYEAEVSADGEKKADGEEDAADRFLNSIGVSSDATQPAAAAAPRGKKRVYTEETEEDEIKRLEKREREMHQAYMERMSRFERQETNRIRAIESATSKHEAHLHQKEILRIQLFEFLRDFDDDVEIQRGEQEFLRDRSRWIHKRNPILRREREQDTRDRMNENEELAKLHAQEMEATREDRERLAAQRALEEQKLREEQEEQERMERLRQEREQEMKERQKEVYHSVAGGHGVVVGRIMTMEERKQAIAELVGSLPTGVNEICAWDVKWDFLEGGGDIVKTKIRSFVVKKVVETLGEENPDIVEFVMSAITKRKGAKYLVDELAGPLDVDAEVFVCKLWRMVMYESESRARGLA
ncbi:hypothetical protein BDR26DRAFT_1007450 [Obelidium mucronatum]|nr:hypothetical protein BDR26DRAFT_1007450 [Obelidium mucronatum]